MFDREGNQVVHADLQVRGVWYEFGETKEVGFVERHGETQKIAINPEKQSNPSLPDLTTEEGFADLKTQNTPLFFANKYYKKDPTYSVTLNLKDVFNYGPEENNYSDFQIFFWVDWIAVKLVYNEKEDYVVKPLTEVYKADFLWIYNNRGNFPIHWYVQRGKIVESNQELRQKLKHFEPRLQTNGDVYSLRGDRGNAACSYVLDVRDFKRISD